MGRILVVDDDRAVRMALRLVLMRNGMETDLAENQQEALRLVRGHDYDVILMDMNYSLSTTGEEGLELLQKVRILSPATPVILITAWGSIQLAVEGMRFGAFDFLTKPFSNQLLLQRIETAVELRRNMSSSDDGFVTADGGFDRCGIVGEDPALLKVLSTVERIAATDASVLILGENGTGKELIADAVHRNSRRRGKPFVKVNLGGVSHSLFESEMFGHVKGAFTGAVSDRKGSFELADTGTIFLDEIGDLNMADQVKLLRVLQEHTFQAVGDSRQRHTDIRVVCATNADLSKMVADRTFREDLFYRINLITLRVPALRERRGDIPMLVRHFIRTGSERHGVSVPDISADAMTWLTRLHYPGNIRELKNMVERAILVNSGGVLEKSDFPEVGEDIADRAREDSAVSAESSGFTLEELERRAVEEALQKYEGNLSKAAASLGITRQSLYRRMEKLNIRN